MKCSSGFLAFSLVGVLLCGAAATVARAEPATAVYPAIFDSREIHANNIAPFHKWTEVLARFRHESSLAKGTCEQSALSGCEPAEWARLRGEISGLDLRSKIERVNAAINHHPYVPSARNWRQVNYWETPFEFLRKNGQCQDYATTKFLLLRAAGVPNDDMRLVIVHDIERGLDHAVLVVYVEGEAFVLDNLFTHVVRASSIHHYRPYYSINETGWWLHKPRAPDAFPDMRVAQMSAPLN